ncbi:MAG: sigma-70 family RNA polymerase sigma factor, partial [Planctomycetota bacterium]|nr:sigma-70 family RNA polymerase sigma factor [Planctomycetota bacterium]
MEPATEKVLLDRSRSGDRGALGELLMAHHAACYSLALRLAGNPADAEDICQKAFLNVIRDISRDCAITNFRSWLLRIVVCAYRHQRRADIARRQRERSRAMESPDITKPAGSSTVEREELRRQLEISLGQLGEDYRLPIFLHYEQGLSYAEVATVLQMPEGTVATNIRRGLGKLRDLMARAGYSGAVPAMVAALQQAPETSVPASLTAFIKNLAPGPAAGGSASPAGDMDAVGPAGEMDSAGPAGGADAGGATGATDMAGAAGAKGSGVPIAATKGGTAMRIMICAAMALLTAAVGILVPEYIGWDRSSASGGSAGAKVTGGKVAGGKEAEKPPAGESKAAEGTPPAGPNSSRPLLAVTPVGTNPVTEPQNREEVFEFTQKPKVEKQGDKWVISFASKGKCDVTVAIVGPDGKIVRHLASGVLGANAPWPFQQGSLSQTLEWDGKDDFGRPAPAGCKVRVGLGLKASYGASLAAMDPYALDPSAIACDREGNVYVLMGIFSNSYLDVIIRAFSREGKYLRTIKPMPAGLPPEKYAGTFDIVGPSENPYYVPMSKSAGAPMRGMGMAVSPQGRLVFSSHGNRTHKFLRFLNTDGSGLCRRCLLYTS